MRKLTMVNSVEWTNEKFPVHVPLSCAVCGESVRRVTHGRNCHQRWPEFRVNDSEANN